MICNSIVLHTFLLILSSCERNRHSPLHKKMKVLLDFSLAVKAETLIFISGCGSAFSTAKEGKSGFIYNLVKS